MLAYIIIIAFHLWISTYNSSTAHNSVRTIVRGSLAGIFWLAIVLFGIVVPLVLVAIAGPGSRVLLTFSAVCVLSGNLALRYIILKAGMYPSLLPL
jgi:formate-dependent nitrite reductase membrane component NrfD